MHQQLLEHPTASSAPPPDLASRLLKLELVVIGGLGAAIFGGWQPPLGLERRWILVLHVLGAVVALGNFIAGAFLMAFTGRARARSVYPFVSQAVQWAEVVLSAPGVLLLLYAGGALVGAYGGPTQLSWLRTSLGLLTVSGLIWGLVLVPLQSQLIALSRDERDHDRWERVARWYSLPGTIAGVLTLVVLVLMVLKPA